MKRNKGLSLIEVLAAAVIIAITMVVTLEFFVYCRNHFISPAKPALMAAYLAQETMEQCAWENSLSLPDQTNTPIPLPDDLRPDSATLQTILDPGELRTIYDGNRTLTVRTNNSYKVVEAAVQWTRRIP